MFDRLPGGDPRVAFVAGTLALGSLGACVAGLVVGEPRARMPAMAAEVSPADGLGANLMRCQRLGDAAISNARCRAAWAEHRQRFLSSEQRQ